MIYKAVRSEISMKETIKMKRTDIYLLFFLLIFTGLFFLLWPLPNENTAEYIQVTVNGKYYGTWALNVPKEITVSSALGKNRITIKNGSAFISKSDCPGQDCIKQKGIKKHGDTIICLPHKLVIEGLCKGIHKSIDTVAH